jgi:methylglutaconyl-CoA hydratase
MAAMGERPARRYFLTAESFSAADALRLGLVHQVVPDEALGDAGKRVLRALLRGGPRSQIEAKDLILALSGRPIDDDLVEDTAQRIARIRTSEEGREGIAAFLDKRRPQWPKN